MSGYPWGGSEELWYRASIAAQYSGHEVEVVVFKKEIIHKKLIDLNLLNIPIHFIEDIKSIAPNILVRKFNKILKIPNRIKYINRFDFLNKRDFNNILISQGSSLDSIYIPDLLKFLQDTSIPFSFLIQHNVEYGFVNDEVQIQAIKIFKKSKKLLFVSERNLKVLQRQLASNLSNSHIVQNPVNLKSKKLLQWPDKGVIKFAVVARLDIDFKGQDLLLEAFSDLRWQQRTFIVNLFGEGPSKEYLKKLIKYFNLTDKVFLKGHFDSIETVWRDHHLLILPSHSEGTPLALLEAMSCGRPAIVTDVGDNTKWIKNGVNGYVVPSATANSLNEILEKAWAERENWERMGKWSGEEMQKRFIEDPEQVVLSQILNEVSLDIVKI
jgi:L-malate glycosyltransferase